MTKTCSESDKKRGITEVELWDIVENGRGDINNIRVTYEDMECENMEYYSHTLVEVADGEKVMTGYWL